MDLRFMLDFVRVIKGDAFDPDRVRYAIEGQDAVLCALGTDLLHRDDPVASEGTRNIITAMKDLGVPRLVVMSAFGIGDSQTRMNPTALALMDKMLGPIMHDKHDQEELVRQSGLEWVIVRPVRLGKGPLTGVYRASPELSPRFTAKISRADVAHFMLDQARRRRHLGTAVTLAY